MLTIKYEDTLGYCVSAYGIQLTDYTPYVSVARWWTAHLVEEYMKREREWEKQLEPYHVEEERQRQWLKDMARKYRMTRTDKLSYYDKHKAVALAMAEAKAKED